MNIPIEPDSPEEKLAKVIAYYLVQQGTESGLALQTAMTLMRIIKEVSEQGCESGMDSLLCIMEKYNKFVDDNYPNEDFRVYDIDSVKRIIEKGNKK